MATELPHSETDGIIRVSLADCVLRGLQSHEISDGLLALVNDRDNPRVIVNLKDIEQMTSVTLAGFLQAHHRAEQEGGKLRLCEASKTVRNVLTMTRLDDVLQVDDDEAASVAALS